MSSPDQFEWWSDVLKTLVGTFTGAGLAFMTAKYLDAAKRHREYIVAGSMALLTIDRQFEEFLVFRAGFYEDVGDPNRPSGQPIWGLTRPSMSKFFDYKIDVNSLSFLLQKREYAPLLSQISHCQLHHENLINVKAFHTETIADLHQNLASFEKSHFGATTDEVEAGIGAYIIAKSNAATLALANLARRNEQKYRDAHDSLRKALETELNVWWWKSAGDALKSFWVKEELFAKLEEPKEDLKLDSLRPMPKVLKDALDKAYPERSLQA